jgi:hypothetical protein
MPFVKRDANHKIVAVYHHGNHEGIEEVPARDPELAAFLYETLIEFAVQKEWLQSDLSLSRVLEDLIEVLMDKGVILFTDLPPKAQEKLRARRGLRREFALIDSLFGDPDTAHSDFL